MEGQAGHLDGGDLTAEQPVFASDRGLKGEFAVRAGILALLALVTAWLTAVILGALGFGNLPDLHLPGARGSANSTEKALASAIPPGLSGAIATGGANTVSGGSGDGSTGSGSGGGTVGGGSTGSGSSGSGTGSGSTGSGSGRGKPTDGTSGGRGAPTTTPNGKNTPGNGHGKGKGLSK